MFEIKRDPESSFFLLWPSRKPIPFLYFDTPVLFFSFLFFYHCKCINNAARSKGITQTLDLPDRTLQFIKDKPLMDQVIQPIGQKPLLVRKGSTFTRIIVDQAQAANGEKHHVMFIGTGACTLSLCICCFNCFDYLTLVTPKTRVSVYVCVCMFYMQKDEGSVLKAVNYDGEMFIIEEIQVFEPPKPIKILKISNVTVM